MNKHATSPQNTFDRDRAHAKREKARRRRCVYILRNPGGALDGVKAQFECEAPDFWIDADDWMHLVNGVVHGGRSQYAGTMNFQIIDLDFIDRREVTIISDPTTPEECDW